MELYSVTTPFFFVLNIINNLLKIVEKQLKQILKLYLQNTKTVR